MQVQVQVQAQAQMQVQVQAQAQAQIQVQVQVQAQAQVLVLVLVLVLPALAQAQHRRTQAASVTRCLLSSRTSPTAGPARESKAPPPPSGCTTLQRCYAWAPRMAGVRWCTLEASTCGGGRCTVQCDAGVVTRALHASPCRNHVFLDSVHVLRVADPRRMSWHTPEVGGRGRWRTSARRDVVGCWGTAAVCGHSANGKKQPLGDRGERHNHGCDGRYLAPH